jgi:hypothetical protein
MKTCQICKTNPASGYDPDHAVKTCAACYNDISLPSRIVLNMDEDLFLRLSAIPERYLIVSLGFLTTFGEKVVNRTEVIDLTTSPELNIWDNVSFSWNYHDLNTLIEAIILTETIDEADDMEESA